MTVLIADRIAHYGYTREVARMDAQDQLAERKALRRLFRRVMDVDPRLNKLAQGTEVEDVMRAILAEAKVRHPGMERHFEGVELRHGLGSARHPLTLQEVGDVMGVTRERARQYEDNALGWLKEVAQQWPDDLGRFVQPRDAAAPGSGAATMTLPIII